MRYNAVRQMHLAHPRGHFPPLLALLALALADAQG
jgi:hypothetical protein